MQPADDLGDTRLPAQGFGKAAKWQYSVPPASPALNMELPLVQIPDGRCRDRVGGDGQPGMVQPGALSQPGAHDVQARAMQFVEQILRTEAAKQQVGRPRQPSRACNGRAQRLDHLVVRNGRWGLGERLPGSLSGTYPELHGK